MTIVEGGKEDQPVNQELRLSAELLLAHDRSVQPLDYCRHCTDLTVDLTLHLSLTCEQELSLHQLRQGLSSHLERSSYLFLLQSKFNTSIGLTCP